MWSKVKAWFRSSAAPAPGDPAAAQKNAREMAELIAQELKPAGFDHQKGTTLWRRTNCKFDILTVDVIPPGRCRQWGTPLGSFLLEASCLIPFLPNTEAAAGHGLNPEKGFGQLRLALKRGMTQREVKADNIWWAGEDAKTVEAVRNDVSAIIRDTVLPAFSRLDDPAELLRVLQEDELSMKHGGIWGLGRKDSPVRLLYTGFAALECGKWDLADATFRACAEKLRTTGKGETGDKVQSKLLPYVETGIARAAQKQGWSLA